MFVVFIGGCKTGAVYGGAPPSSSTLLAEIQGSTLVANDGTYLGKITTNMYDSNSIANPYGYYGSKYSSRSILNEYGTYGSAYSIQSPFDKYSSTPPEIVQNGVVIGYVTTNPNIADSINPYTLFGLLEKG
jgi:hypothetical protein